MMFWLSDAASHPLLSQNRWGYVGFSGYLDLGKVEGFERHLSAPVFLHSLESWCWQCLQWAMLQHVDQCCRWIFVHSQAC